MRRLIRLLATLAALAHLASAQAADYRGFQVDESAATLAPAARASLQAQLDVVDAVGLPETVLAVFKATPIVVDPNLRGNPGIFAVRGGRGAVFVQPIVFGPGRPILLHELLHAYHARVLGVNNPDIVAAYRQARQGDAFPARFQSAHFLENEKEFFAVTGTLFLFGDIQQPPFACAALGKLDPAYLALLSQLFGPHRCNNS